MKTHSLFRPLDSTSTNMVLDRDYMQDPYTPGRQTFGQSGGLTGNKILMILLVGIYVVQMIMIRGFGLPVNSYLGLEPDAVVYQFSVWQPFTYMFFHPLPENWGLWILIFNLIGLFFFGPLLESRWGRTKYLLFFFSAGVFAALVYVPVASLFRTASNTVLGAMGPVLAVLVASAMSRPNMPVLLFFVLPVKMKYMIWLFIGMDVFILFQDGYTSIARTVPHLAGAAFGFIYFLYHTEIDRFLDEIVSEEDYGEGSTGVSAPDPPSSLDRKHHEEIDDILDKIHENGINSLTDEERKILEDASQQLNDDEFYDPFQKNSR